MKKISELFIKSGNHSRSVVFSQVETCAEKKQVFKLRYDVYSKRGYIEPGRFNDGFETDEYDLLESTKYFFVSLIDNGESKIIGCARLISSNPLPTQNDFIFQEPETIHSIDPNNRYEIGRLIIIPPSKAGRDFLPRGIVMLFLFNAIAQYCNQNGLVGGYAFIKMSLNLKMKKNRFPFYEIDKYVLNYPQDGILHQYFNQVEDKVIPIYFLTREILDFSNRIIHNRLLFKKHENIYVLRNSYVLNIIRYLKIV